MVAAQMKSSQLRKQQRDDRTDQKDQCEIKAFDCSCCLYRVEIRLCTLLQV